jgi:hypothetical protein
MATQKSLMIIVEKNTDGKVSNVGRKFFLEQINGLSPEAMAAGFGATIRELEAQIDAFIPAAPEPANETKTQPAQPAPKKAALAKA